MLRELNDDGTPKLTCQNADCENDEHCFRPKASGKAWKNPTGDCKYCGESPVDWGRVRRRDTSNITALKEELRKEWIRNYFWNKDIDAKSKDKLSKMSREEVEKKLRRELQVCVGPAQPFKDGYRVPITDEKLAGQPFAYAQHATAACCTKCAYYWWGFERNTKYTDDQIDFLTNLCMGYLEDRGLIPKL